MACITFNAAGRSYRFTPIFVGNRPIVLDCELHSLAADSISDFEEVMWIERNQSALADFRNGKTLLFPLCKYSDGTKFAQLQQSGCWLGSYGSWQLKWVSCQKTWTQEGDGSQVFLVSRSLVTKKT